MENRSKNRLVRVLSVASGLLIVCSVIISATSPSPRSFLWGLNLSLGLSGAILIFAALITWVNPSKQKTDASVD
jgi:hypothetical protein